jgi:hypothetical protein
MTDATTPAPNPYPATAPAASGGGVGIAALFIGVVLVLINTVIQIVGLNLPQLMVDAGLDVEDITGVYATVAMVTGVVAVIAVVLGIVGIQPSRSRGRLAGAAGLALGAAYLVGALVSLVGPVILSLTD